MPAFLLLAACYAVPIAAGAIALAASFKTGSDSGENLTSKNVPSRRFKRFRRSSQPVQERMK